MSRLPSGLGRRLAIAIAAGGLMLGGGVAATAPPPYAPFQARGGLEERLRAEGASSDVLAFYERRDFRPLWIEGARPNGAAISALESLRDAERHGLSPDSYLDPVLMDLLRKVKASQVQRTDLQELEVRLSTTFPRFVQDLRRPSPANDLIRVDPVLGTTADPAEMALAPVAAHEGSSRGVALAMRMDPLYQRMAEGLARWRRTWAELPSVHLPPGPDVSPGGRDARVALLRRRLGEPPLPEAADRLDPVLAARLADFQLWHGLEPSGRLDHRTVEALNTSPVRFEQAIATNLDRLRALPPDPDPRRLVVNVAAASLTAYEDGREVRTMRVIVGRPSSPTPMLAGVVRHAILTPYWNIPQDLVRDQIAPAVLRGGRPAFEARKLEALADWSEDPQRLEPEAIDWTAVRSGAQPLRIRQKPGPHNMMGKVKFMLPNDLGIYLHDTPDRSGFERTSRALSAGCVRLEDAEWLGHWLFGASLAALTSGEAEQKLDLNTPTPVFLLYQTVAPRAGGGFIFHPDVYGRDLSSMA